MMLVIKYQTTRGRIPYVDFLKSLHNKKHDDNSVHLAQSLVKKLENEGLDLEKTGELKSLDKNFGLYELKRKNVRIGVYLFKDPKSSKFVVLDGFLKDSQKTRKSDLDRLRSEIKDYESRRIP